MADGPPCRRAYAGPVGTHVIQRFGHISLLGVVLLALAACQAVAPTPVPTSPPEVTVTVPVLIKDKAVISAAADVLSARVKALGIGTFSVGIGDSMVFSLPASPPPDQAKIQAAFRARGDVAFLPIPVAAGAPQVGSPAPIGIAPLFDADGQVTAATVVDSNGAKALEIHLGPAGTAALAAYSTSHVGDDIAIVLDGVVLFLPKLMEPLTDGRLVVSFPPDQGLPYALDVLAAILASGPLPAAWP